MASKVQWQEGTNAGESCTVARQEQMGSRVRKQAGEDTDPIDLLDRVSDFSAKKAVKETEKRDFPSSEKIASRWIVTCYCQQGRRT